MTIELPKPIEFEWDEGNKEKNLIKHGITFQEIEQAFFDEFKKMAKDVHHSGVEERGVLIGRTFNNVVLFISYTIRKERVRVISARPLNKRERHRYEKTTS